MGWEAAAAPLEDRWILSRLNRVAQQMNAALADYRFHEAANVIYTFFWGEFCDWYIELVKPRLAGGDTEEAKGEQHRARQLLASLFETALRLLSPIMPFITEELWHAIYLGNAPHKSIALAEYPRGDAKWIDDGVEIQMSILQDLIVSVRNIRAELKIEPRLKVPVQVHADREIGQLVRQNLDAVQRLGSVEQVEFVEHSLAQEAGARSTARFNVRVIYERKIDVAAERERLQKELARIDKQTDVASRQLGNQQFLTKAPEHVVEGLKKQLDELKVMRAKILAALEGLN